MLERDTTAAEIVRSSKLTSLARSPLAMGLLSGLYSEDRLPEEGMYAATPRTGPTFTDPTWLPGWTQSTSSAAC